MPRSAMARLGFMTLVVMMAVTICSVRSAESSRPVKVLVAGIEGHILLATAWLGVDPLTDPYPLPARSQDSSWSGGEIARFIRIYFPRTYQKLLEFEYIMLTSIEVWVFSQTQQKMLHDSIHVDGLGAMQERSVMSMHSYISIPWADSVLSDAFPNDADAVVSIDYTLHSEPMRVVINTNERIPPVFTPYRELPGVEYSFGGAYGTNLAIPKEGAVVTSYSVGPYQFGYPGSFPDPRYGGVGWIPHTMYWKYGNGTTWTHQDTLGMYWNTLYNPYAPDMILAELIYSTGRQLPDDVVLLHRLRGKFAEFSSSRSFIHSILDFIDRFGARTDDIVEALGQTSQMVNTAEELYREQRYEEASSSMEAALGEIEGLRIRSLRAKDQALLWIYVIEWVSVSGVMLAASFAVWTLMVRRRLYREVRVTRLASSADRP